MLHRQQFFEGPLGDGYDVVVCDRCGAGFADGIPAQEELDRYYAERSKYTYAHNDGAESAFDLKRFQKIADQIEPYLPDKSARILDIGCATGGLLAELKKRGYRNLVGSDPSQGCAVAARKLYDLDVRIAAMSELVRWTDRYDAVLLVGVLEHLRDVGLAIRITAQLLAPQGLVYCAQPDVEAFSDCRNAPFQQFSIEHINFFSSISLQRAFACQGLVPCKLWRWMVEWRESITDSVVSSCFVASPARIAVPHDVRTEAAIRRYLSASATGDERLLKAIQHQVESRQPVIVWGAGTLTRRLLSTTRLGEANIVAFVDSNPHVQGLSLFGRPILAPAEIRGRKESILICSTTFRNEIALVIRKQLGLLNEIITLPNLE